MRKTMTAISLLAALATVSTASAQDVGPVFDMGQLTGSLSVDHITQSERARAARMRSPSSKARHRQACAKLPRFRAQYGATNPKIIRLGQLCRRAGY